MQNTSMLVEGLLCNVVFNSGLCHSFSMYMTVINNQEERSRQEQKRNVVILRRWMSRKDVTTGGAPRIKK